MSTRGDIELRRRVQVELDWEPGLRDQQIALAVRNGVVTLLGQVVDTKRKHLAKAAARRVCRTAVVVDQVRVRSDCQSSGSDIVSACTVHDRVKRHLKTTTGSIKATVVRGWVTLEGEVELFQQRLDAERGLRWIPGIQGVTNQIKVITATTRGEKRM